MAEPDGAPGDRPQLGAAMIATAAVVISVQDTMIKQLSGDYPLHQIVFARSVIGLVFSIGFLMWEGGFRQLKTENPGLHLVRGLLIVMANMTYFAGLAVMPLAEATSLFYIAPIFITLLSIPFLGENVGTKRLTAAAIGFIGVLLVLRPGSGTSNLSNLGIVAVFPVLAALFYASMQIMTRKLGVKAKASAMAIYVQGTFIVVGIGFWLVAGDGRYAVGVENQSLQFLLRAWQWPAGNDIYLFLGCGVASGVIAYTIAQAYRVAQAATVAPFEYIAPPLAVFWGWMVWHDLPDTTAALGIALIIGSGVFVFIREGRKKSGVSSKRPLRRW